MIDTSLWADEVRAVAVRRRALQRGFPYCSRLSHHGAIVGAIGASRTGNPRVKPAPVLCSPHSPLKSLFASRSPSGAESKTIVEGLGSWMRSAGTGAVRVSTAFVFFNAVSARRSRELRARQRAGVQPANFRRTGWASSAAPMPSVHSERRWESAAFRGCYNARWRAARAGWFSGLEEPSIKTTLRARVDEVCRCDLSGVRGSRGAARRTPALLPQYRQHYGSATIRRQHPNNGERRPYPRVITRAQGTFGPFRVNSSSKACTRFDPCRIVT